MRRSNTRPLSEIIKEILQQTPAGQKLKEVQLINAWEDLVGKTIARKTRKLYIRNGKLYVELTSSVVRNELMMLRSSLLEALNRRAGEEIVSDIVLK